MEKLLQIITLFILYLHQAYAQNQSFTDVIQSELGLAIIIFVAVIVGLVLLTWACFCVCMCRVSYEARQEEKMLKASEERAYEQREMEMRYRHYRDASARLKQQQHDIEKSIMMNRHQSSTFFQHPPITEEEEDIMLDSASVLHAQIQQGKARAPQQHQQRMLSSFQSIPQTPAYTSNTTYTNTQITEEFDYDSSSSIDSDDIVDIMNMPAMIPRPRYY